MVAVSGRTEVRVDRPKGKTMTVADVLARVAEIASMSDDEAQHSMEDGLWSEVLTAIAEGSSDPAGLARAALKTEDLDFARWCA